MFARCTHLSAMGFLKMVPSTTGGGGLEPKKISIYYLFSEQVFQSVDKQIKVSTLFLFSRTILNIKNCIFLLYIGFLIIHISLNSIKRNKKKVGHPFLKNRFQSFENQYIDEKFSSLCTQVEGYILVDSIYCINCIKSKFKIT